MANKVKQIGKMSVKIISNSDLTLHDGLISTSDAEMDKRAVAAVRSAIHKAKICNKPIARYDIKTQKAFLEYADGSIQYVN
ncbi:MAG: hypothetical protein IIU24_10315 [Selenomonas sp.]|nr:hypothetical protein [Selenomonas sp.]